MKNRIITLCMLPCIILMVQTSRAQLQHTHLFAEISGYRHTLFQENSFFDGEIGIGFLTNFWISPEVGFSYSFGGLEEITTIDPLAPNLATKSILKTTYRAQLLTLSPKITIGKNSDDLWWVIQPKFLTGNLTVKRDDLSLSNTEDHYRATSKENNSYLSFFTLSVGLEGYPFESEKISLAFFIKYTTMQLNDKFNFPDTPNIDVSTPTLGIGFRVCFSPFKK